MPTSIEAQGHTVDEAIQIALNQLGVSRDKVEIDILHHPRRGVLGIGARRAKVRATIRESVMPDGEEFDMSGGDSLDDKPRRRRRRGGRSRGRDEGPESESAPRPAVAAREPARADGERRAPEAGRTRPEDGNRGRDDRRGGRGGGRGRGDQRGGAAGGEGRPEAQAPRGGGGGQRGQRGSQQGRGPDPRRGQDQPRGAADQRDQRGGPEQRNGTEGQREAGRDDSRDRSQRGRQGSQGGRDLGRDSGRSGRPDSAADDADFPLRAEAANKPPQQSRAAQTVVPRRPPAAEEPPLDAATLELVRERAEELVRDLLQKMGFAAEVSSSIDEVASEAVVSVRSESEGLLIGRRGQTLDSLEHIVNRMTLRAEAYVEGRVLLDIGDYRKRRRESLDELAGRLRARAVGERRTVQVSPMSPRDRRFFAQAFADDESVEVRALGAGFYRRVVVAPAGMASSSVDAADTPVDVDVETVE
ncbi:MAG: RNA-binding cell elongation regulator Jag/EloR, partial [Candidatus Binatia bacterium]